MVRLGNSVLALDEDAASVADAVRIRDALDPLLVEDALRHASPDDLTAMRRELARMRAAATALDGTAFVHANCPPAVERPRHPVTLLRCGRHPRRRGRTRSLAAPLAHGSPEAELHVAWEPCCTTLPVTAHPEAERNHSC
jgi:hypothetical protein